MPSPVAERDERERRLAGRRIRVAVGDAAPGRHALDLDDLGGERHRRPEPECARIRAVTRAQSVNADADPHRVVARVGPRERGLRRGDVPPGRIEASRACRRDRLVEDPQLSGRRLVARVREMRPDALDANAARALVHRGRVDEPQPVVAERAASREAGCRPSTRSTSASTHRGLARRPRRPPRAARPSRSRPRCPPWPPPRSPPSPRAATRGSAHRHPPPERERLAEVDDAEPLRPRVERRARDRDRAVAIGVGLHDRDDRRRRDDGRDRREVRADRAEVDDGLAHSVLHDDEGDRDPRVVRHREVDRARARRRRRRLPRGGMPDSGARHRRPACRASRSRPTGRSP